MVSINVMLDNSAANILIDLESGISQDSDKSNKAKIEDMFYMVKVNELADKHTLHLYHNPITKHEAGKTKVDSKRNALLKKLQRISFTKFHSTTFPIVLLDDTPATFLSNEQKHLLTAIFDNLPPKFRHDERIVAAALFDPEVKFQFLLTCDRDHLANAKLQNELEKRGISLKVCTPKLLFEQIKCATIS